MDWAIRRAKYFGHRVIANSKSEANCCWHGLCGTMRLIDWRVEAGVAVRESFCRMKRNSQLSKIEVYQNLGFLGIIGLCFLDDLLQLPSLIFSGNPFAFVYRRSTLDMLLVLAVWFLVSRSTRRILDRVHYLEKFMRVCAWCRRINFKDEWMPLEEFMRQSFDTPTTHGICKECLGRQKVLIDKAKERKRAAAGG